MDNQWPPKGERPPQYGDNIYADPRFQFADDNTVTYVPQQQAKPSALPGIAAKIGWLVLIGAGCIGIMFLILIFVAMIAGFVSVFI